MRHLPGQHLLLVAPEAGHALQVVDVALDDLHIAGQVRAAIPEQAHLGGVVETTSPRRCRPPAEQDVGPGVMRRLCDRGAEEAANRSSKVAARASEAGNAVTLSGPRMPLGPSVYRSGGMPRCATASKSWTVSAIFSSKLIAASRSAARSFGGRSVAVTLPSRPGCRRPARPRFSRRSPGARRRLPGPGPWRSAC